ncbi:MAG: hypothetical protein HQK54_18005 [Oligoflexales bacterium]|nr:hypothetical protein [Oligoflexales bacterium]
MSAPVKLRPLTEKQKKILWFIVYEHYINKRIPRQIDIARKFAINQHAAATHLKFIEKKGYITKKPHIPQSITLSAQAIRLITGKSPQRMKSQRAVIEVFGEEEVVASF